jgi:hypothetical protein
MTRKAHRGSPLPVRALALGVLAFVLALATVDRGSPGDGARLRTAMAPSAETGAVVVGTVPAVAGFTVTLDGLAQITDSEGKAVFEAVSFEPALANRVTGEEVTLPINGQQVLVRPAQINTSGSTVVMSLELSYLVHFRFADTLGTALDAATVDKVVVKSETGEIVTVQVGEDRWLQGSRVVGGRGALRVRLLSWSVQEVVIAGANVVNASQQRFLPAQTQDVAVELLLFDMHVYMYDALFGFSYSGAVDLEYPDGHTRRFDLDEEGRLTVPDLPRGEYTVTPIGPGPTMPRPLALSRAQEVNLAFYSWLDIMVILGAFLGLAGGLAWVGRVRRRSPPVPEPEPAPAPAPGRHARERNIPDMHWPKAQPDDRRPYEHSSEPSSDDAVASDHRP